MLVDESNESSMALRKAHQKYVFATESAINLIDQRVKVLEKKSDKLVELNQTTRKNISEKMLPDGSQYLSAT